MTYYSIPLSRIALLLTSPLLLPSPLLHMPLLLPSNSTNTVKYPKIRGKNSGFLTDATEHKVPASKILVILKDFR